MLQQLKRYFNPAFLVVLCVGLSISGCQTSQVSVNNIPIHGAITHVREPDNTSNTEIDILIEAEEGIDPATINELMRNILGGNFRNIHNVLLIKNGKLVLEEYFSGYERGIKHTIQSDSEDEKGRVKGLSVDIGFSRLEYDKTKWF